MNFNEKLKKISIKNNSILSVGLDIDEEKIPKFLFDYKDPYFRFNKAIINSTKDLICAYKINLAFYEAFGKKGYILLEKTIDFIPKEIIIILDGKRNDIGNTAKKYAKALFEKLKADAVTVNPYLGSDGIKPFLEYKDKCSFILCRTSNPSAVDFQNLKAENKTIYYHVASKIKDWNKNNNCGAVVGATYPNELKEIRTILGDNIPLLIPGIGKQGGNVEKTVKFAVNSKDSLAIINSSRGVIYKGNDESFDVDSRNAAIKLNQVINKFR